MADVTGSSSSSETLAQLDALLGREQARNEASLAGLSRLVAGLGTGVYDPIVLDERARARSATSQEVAPPVVYPLLPRRTTHGGPFGASVVDRVVARMGKETW